MGFITADIVKIDDDYVWKGEKNLQIYEKQFEEYLIQKVIIDHNSTVIRLKKSTVKKARDGFAISIALSI